MFFKKNWGGPWPCSAQAQDEVDEEPLEKSKLEALG
jgi:hypothetical protein